MGLAALRRALAGLGAGLALLLVSDPASAHLCNDVFAQAKDNLAVKVDIRDGQLRIAREASFKVYLLNTMDRDIVDISLKVECEQFASTVTPGKDWRSFPSLKTAKNGGRKEWFEVTLSRKPSVRDGRYKIELHLVNGRDPRMTFKALAIEATTDALALPRAKGVKVDGAVGGDEWRKGLLVSDFYRYEKVDRYFENVRAEDQPRYRLLADDDYLYALFSVRKATGSDLATMWVAKDPDATPVSVEFDLRTGEARCAGDSSQIQCRLSPGKDALECRIPRKLLGLEGKEGASFLANFTRTAAGREEGAEPVVSYWRGNRVSVANPVVYARLTIAAP